MENKIDYGGEAREHVRKVLESIYARKVEFAVHGEITREALEEHAVHTLLEDYYAALLRAQDEVKRLTDEVKDFNYDDHSQQDVINQQMRVIKDYETVVMHQKMELDGLQSQLTALRSKAELYELLESDKAKELGLSIRHSSFGTFHVKLFDSLKESHGAKFPDLHAAISHIKGLMKE